MLIAKDVNVLILESDPSRSKQLQSSFVAAGVNSVSLSVRIHTAEAAAKAGCHLIVIGDRCADGDASEALAAFQKNEEIRDIPCFLYTASDDPKAIRELITQGFSGVIRYPADVPQLMNILRNYTRQQNTQELAQCIKSATFFKEFSEEELKQLSKVAIIRHYEPGTTIINKGDPSDGFFILIKGTVEVLMSKKRRPPIRLTIDEGSCFGEMGVIDNSPRSAYCIAADNCWVLEIGAHILDDVNYTLRLRILSQVAFVLAKRIRKMNILIDPDEKEQEEKEEIKPVEAPKPQVTVVKVPPPIEEEEDDQPKENPWSEPSAQAEQIDGSIHTNEEYNVLTRKITLRSDFILNKLPKTIYENIANRMYSYWTGSKLAKINPHKLWDSKLFINGKPLLKRAMHMVILCSDGDEAYEKCFLGLPLSHRVIGLTQRGCTGTFLSNDDAIARYFAGRDLASAIKGDLEMPIDRLWKGNEQIEYLTHTHLDVREETLFVVFDDKDGKNTQFVRSHYPEHQIVTVVRGVGYNLDNAASLFTGPESSLTKEKLIHPRDDYQGHGFYSGETVFIPDLSNFFHDTPALSQWGYLFGTITIFANMGPDYSGDIWGSKGGAEGAVRAARAMFGVKGAQSAQDLASAVNWADS